MTLLQARAWALPGPSHADRGLDSRGEDRGGRDRDGEEIGHTRLELDDTSTTVEERLEVKM